MDVADTARNVKGFGRPNVSRGTTTYPQLRFVSLVENGTHALVGSQLAAWFVNLSPPRQAPPCTKETMGAFGFSSGR